ncbi:MAG: outer membrane protein assembly factor BamD [Kiritimatiellales bacterium]|nr:outer membrane protein assembly factor BamD [Kiritimatiellales bacterium]
MRYSKSIQSILLFSLLFAGALSAAVKDAPYVIEEKGRSTLRTTFDKRFDSAAEQWEYAQSLRNKKKLKKAERAMLYLVRRWPNSEAAPDAQRAKADILFARGKNIDAFKEYQYLIDNYSSRMPDYNGVLQSQFDIAVTEMNRKRMRWLFMGFRAPEKSVEYFEAVIRNGPQWERAPEAQYMIGKAYQESGDYELAIAGYSVMDYRYPNSPFAEDAMFQKILCLGKLRKEYPYSEETLDRILTATTVFLGTFPRSERRDDIIKLRNALYEDKAGLLFGQAEFYEKVPKKPESALIYYRMLLEQYPKSVLVGKAQEQIVRLEAMVAATKKPESAMDTAVPTAEKKNATPESVVVAEKPETTLGEEAPPVEKDKPDESPPAPVKVEINADKKAAPPAEKKKTDVDATPLVKVEIEPDEKAKEPAASKTRAKTGTSKSALDNAKALGDIRNRKFTGEEALELNADRLEYVDNTIIASGSVTGRFEDVTLLAEKISANPETGDLHLEGDIFFSQGANYWQGSGLDYNFKTKSGLFGPSEMFFDPAYVSAENVQRVSTNEFLLKNASFTTCPRAHPHFHATAKEAHLIDETYIKAKGMTFYYGKIPVMYLPYWERRLEDRIFTTWTGYSSEMGAFLLTETQLPITDNIDSKTRIDFRTRRGVGLGQGFDWAYSNAVGEVSAYYLNDQDPHNHNDSATDRTLIDEDRYRINLEHRQKFADTHYLDITGDYISDPDVLDDFFNREYRTLAQPENYASYVYGHEYFGAETLVSKELNDFYDNTDRIGQSLDLYRTRLGDSPFYFQSDNNAYYLERIYSSTNKIDNDYDAVRLDSANTLYAPLRLGVLNLIPRATYRATYYSDSPPLGTEDDKMRHIFETGAEASFKAYKTLTQRRGFYGDGIRHKIEPYVDYTYRLDPSVGPNDLYQFDHVDTLDERNDIKLGLRNVLQTKRNKRNTYIVDLDIFTYYRFDHSSMQEDFDYLYADMRMPLTERIMLDVEGAYDWYGGDFPIVDTRLGWHHDDVILSMEHRYKHNLQSLWTPRVELFPNQKVSLDFYMRYDGENSELEETEVILYYTYCCMRYGLGYRHEDDDNDEVWFTFTLSAFPDSALSIGR